jgi:hypothetical protein
MSARIGPRPPGGDLGLEDLRRVRAKPVFILGLHRSGTTWLYQMIAGALPVALLTAHRVVDYDRILTLHREGSTAAAERKFDDLVQSWHMATRGIDAVPLSHAMPEEYGWILRRTAGAFYVNSRTAPVLDELCRKLQYLTPSAGAVVLKNPWDSGYAEDLLAYLPDARFIFLRRDPVAIVNSQFRIAKLHGGRRDPYLDLLLEGIPLGRAWVRLQRILRRALGASFYGRMALRYIFRDVARELVRLETSWKAVPANRRRALNYADLLSDPDGAIDKVAGFLSLPLLPEPDIVKPRPGDQTLLPEVADAESSFRMRLDRRGIVQD